ncbi:hypothetical protein [Paraflavitalea pollutisoli]|uniref:hypothetical protein n=1 Tax=Paraflavitalea pollutisoli TaxID=3034143 RepID=UPI0023ECF239|nr:hypothetical protein [Paraflavitalea sp. H1-2-19X]
MSNKKINAVEAIGIIQRLNDKTTYGQVYCNNFDTPFIGILKKQKERGYKLAAFSKQHLSIDRDIVENITFQSHNAEYRLIDTFQNRIRHHHRDRKGTYSRRELQVNSFQPGGNFPDHSYLRAILPITEGFLSIHYFTVEPYSYITEPGKLSNASGLVRITLLEDQFTICQVRAGQELFLIIDCDAKMSYETFRERCWAISIGLAFVNGHLWQNEQYIFSYATEDMTIPTTWRYTTLRPSILTIYSGLTGNAASWLRGSAGLHQKYKGKTIEISTQALNKLCNWIHSCDAHKVIALLIIEAKRSSLLMMPAGFALALEGLATLFEQKFPEKINPIKLRTKAKEFRDRLLSVLEDYRNDPDFNPTILQNKINEINKATNRDRLKIPFKLLGIPLSGRDVLALDYRNALLHGNVILEPMEEKTFEMNELELGMRLLTLTNAIILKWMGYKGWVVNHVKAQENAIGLTIDEEYYRDIGELEDIDEDVMASPEGEAEV